MTDPSQPKNPPDPYGPPSGQPYGYPPAPPAAAGYGQPSTSGGLILDPRGISIPEGTQLASVGRRIGAYFLAIPLFIITLGIGYIVWGLVLWGQGTTPALKVLGMRCWLINDNKVPGWGRMFLRDFVGRIVDGILSIITALISFIMFVSGDKRQSLHDLVGGTTVLYDPNKVLA